MQDFTEMADEQLLDLYDRTRFEELNYTEHRQRIEMALFKRMAERHAMAIPSEEFVCELKVADTYDQLAFTPLKEILNEDDLKTCFTPAHQETVEVAEKWQTVKVKAAARRYGTLALDVIERARIPGAPRLKFSRKAVVAPLAAP